MIREALTTLDGSFASLTNGLSQGLSEFDVDKDNNIDMITVCLGWVASKLVVLLIGQCGPRTTIDMVSVRVDWVATSCCWIGALLLIGQGGPMAKWQLAG
jgi:hypothetical protein